MREVPFSTLSAEAWRDALGLAELEGHQRADLLEKDVWVVATLACLFDAPFGEHLVFKGGTSLSKVWRLIRRFSEDIDVTYDIRAFAPDHVAGAGDEAMAPTRSQQKRWTDIIRARLKEWVRDEARPAVEAGLAKAGLVAPVWADEHRLYVGFESLFQARSLLFPTVLVEFGARSTGEPNQAMPVSCDAAAHLPGLSFPEARPSVMLPERTFWEKVSAAHVFCRRARARGVRQSRHWHDLARLVETGVADRALADRELAGAVARHNAVFYIEKDIFGERIDYHAVVSGGAEVVPTGAARDLLADDYAATVATGMMLDETESFDELMERCARLEARINAAGGEHSGPHPAVGT